MDTRHSVTTLPSKYDDFLFTLIYEGTDGAQLTVLSALARANVDPWEEAARVSAMTEADAQNALTVMIDRISECKWTPAEEAAIVSRLIRHLPERAGRIRTVIGSPTYNFRALVFISVWWSFAILISVISQQQRIPPPPASNVVPQSSASEPSMTGPTGGASASANVKSRRY